MGFFDWLAAFFRALFGGGTPSESEPEQTDETEDVSPDEESGTSDEPEDTSSDEQETDTSDKEERVVEVPASPLTHSGNSGATTLRVSLYQTTGLTGENGRYPEQNIASFLGQALADAGYNYVIEFGHEPLDLSDESTKEVLNEFAGRGSEDSHVNLLIGNRAGGGMSWLGARYGLVAGGETNKLVEVTERAPVEDDVTRPRNLPGPYRNALNAIHETGHLLGGEHEDNMTDPPSMLFNNVDAGWLDSPAP